MALVTDAKELFYKFRYSFCDNPANFLSHLWNDNKYFHIDRDL